MVMKSNQLTKNKLTTILTNTKTGSGTKSVFKQKQQEASSIEEFMNAETTKSLDQW